MKRRLWILMAVLLIALSLSSAEEGITITDMCGRVVRLDKPAERVVALSPSDCEILAYLGCEEMLLGRGTYCDYPESILSVPVVESGAQTNIEQIIALVPEVVLMTEMAQTVEQIDMLENAGIRVVVSDADDIEGTYYAIEMIGTLLGKYDEAQKLIQDMKSTFEKVSSLSKNAGKTVYFEVSPLEWGLWTAGTGTFMNEIAEMCGLTNAFGDLKGWKEISQEQVLARNPDYIITTAMYFGDGQHPVDEIMNRAGWGYISAVQTGNVFLADSNAITRPGPRLMEAAEAMHAFIEGQISE